MRAPDIVSILGALIFVVQQIRRQGWSKYWRLWWRALRWFKTGWGLVAILAGVGVATGLGLAARHLSPHNQDAAFGLGMLVVIACAFIGLLVFTLVLRLTHRGRWKRVLDEPTDPR